MAAADRYPARWCALRPDAHKWRHGTLFLDCLGWVGEPGETFGRPEGSGSLWRHAWVDGVDQFEGRWPEPYRIVQNAGTGVICQGTAEWRNYRVDAPISIYLAKAEGIAARVQGLRGYYALLLCADGVARLVKALAGTHTLAEVPFQWSAFETHRLALEVAGSRVRGWIDGEAILSSGRH